jgi:lipopolysaccharide transport system permease protein
MTAETASSMTASAPDDHAAPQWRIEAAPPSVLGQLRAIWRYRQMFWMLTIRALFNIYRGAVLGIVWMAIHPLVLAVPAIFIVGDLFGVSTDPAPLPLFILTGLAAWTLFRRCVQWMTKSVSQSKAVLQRIYVPALLLLLAMASPGVFQLLVVLGLVVGLAVWYGPVEGLYFVPIGWHMLALFPAVLLLMMAAIAVGCVTSILNAVARDTWLTLRYVLSAWMLATPVVYPVSVIPEDYRWLVYLNPLTAPVELFRWALIGYGDMNWAYLSLSVAMIIAMLYGGLAFFARQQSRIFDHI